jgi:oligopeptide transport system ATP-binding protein
MSDPVLQVTDLVKHFIKRELLLGREISRVQAVDGVSFTLPAGQTLGVVGESGCGKSTLARCILRLVEPTAGRIVFRGTDISGLDRKRMHPLRREMMMVFQDPYGSLNPRKRVGWIVSEPLEVHHRGGRAEVKDQVRTLLSRVGLSPEHYNRLPHEFSGGQRQRIGIARALALEPKLIVCDEPVSALDVSVQSQILNLLADLQQELGMSYVFITHNLDVVRHVANRVLVMYLGRVVEEGPVEELYRHPLHPYTASLLSAAPVPSPRLARLREPIVLEGDVPSPINPPRACRFHPRCPRAREICGAEQPVRRGFGTGHFTDCHFPIQTWPLKRAADIRDPSA